MSASPCALTSLSSRKLPRRQSRLPGLDGLRCIAILAVLLYHYPRSSDQIVLRAASHYGWVGVDLFFVLSGYLIAGQAFAAVIRGTPISAQDFYARRARRILPNYFVMLGCYAVLSLIRGTSIRPLWRHLTFSQNFGIPTAFSQSWSLCVEQHFYLAFPVVIWLVLRYGARHAGLYVFVVILSTEVAVRYGIWSWLRPDLVQDPNRAWEAFLAHIYYPTHTRLDGIACGVGLAAIEYLRPRTWLRLMSLGNWLLLPAAVLLAVAAFAMRSQMGLFYCVFSFTILGLGFSFLVAAALVPNGLLDRLRLRAIETIAVWSYAIYLTHVFAFATAEEACKLLGLSQYGFGMLAFSLLTIFGFGAALFYGVERRFLRSHGR